MALSIVICDETPLCAAALRDFIAADPGLDVVGTFRTAESLLEALDRLDPNLIVIDLELAGMGAVAAIDRIMSSRPRPILIISSDGATSDREARALAAGALEAIPRTGLRIGAPDDLWSTALRSRIKRLASVRLSRPPVTPACDRPLRIVGIGASTGGPAVLAELLGALPASFALPVLVVQHIAPGFASGLLAWLDGEVALPVAFAEHGTRAGPGVWFAPEDTHLGLDRQGRFVVDGDTVHGAHRPSVDMLFESLAANVREGALGIVLTGMGRDGAHGVKALLGAGGVVIAQQEDGCAVFGMPRAAIESGADRVLGIAEIAATLSGLRAGAVA